MKTIDIIAGARPNFMKIAPIISALKLLEVAGGKVRFRLIHTGQHSDARMSDNFFIQLGIPKPDINLNVNYGTQAEQTAQIMIKYEKLLMQAPPDLCLVVGDVNSTLACALTSKKSGIPVAHVEAGIRSGDWSMPEEINRIVTDSISDWFFTTTETARENLLNAGIKEEKIFFVGNTMVDSLLANLENLKKPDLFDSLQLKHKDYFVLTLHRPANVDVAENLSDLLNAIVSGTRDLPVVFPVHPRTANTITSLNNLAESIKIVEPQPYLQFNYLVKHAKAVITDSGGITEEATVLNIPCLTLRSSTERPETICIGTNELVGTNPKRIATSLEKIFEGNWKEGKIPPQWDGLTSSRIVKILSDILSADPIN